MFLSIAFYYSTNHSEEKFYQKLNCFMRINFYQIFLCCPWICPSWLNDFFFNFNFLAVSQSLSEVEFLDFRKRPCKCNIRENDFPSERVHSWTACSNLEEICVGKTQFRKWNSANLLKIHTRRHTTQKYTNINSYIML